MQSLNDIDQSVNGPITSGDGFFDELARLRQLREDMEYQRKAIMYKLVSKKLNEKDRLVQEEKLKAIEAKQLTNLRQLKEAMEAMARSRLRV